MTSLSIAKAGLAARDQKDDDVLVAAYVAKADWAAEAIYRRYHRRVFSIVLRIVGAGEAEEVAQEAFVRIFRGLPKFRGDSALSTWVYRLSVNAALTHLSRQKRHRRKSDEDLSQIPAPEATYRDPRLAERLSVALAKLPKGYRSVLVLHDIEGLNHEECAKIMGCRVGTSKSQLHKARARMRELLAEGVRP